MIIKRQDEKGIALVTSLIMTTAVIGILTVVLYKITATTKEIVVVQKINAAKNIADEGLENVIDWLNNRNNPNNYSLSTPSFEDRTELLRTMSAQEFVQPLNSIQDIYALESATQNKTISTYLPNTGVRSIYNQSDNSKTNFIPMINPNIESVATNGTSLTQVGSNAKVYSYTNIGKNNNNSTDHYRPIGQFKIAVSETNLGTTQFDILKIGVNSYIPNYDDPNAIVKKYVAVVQRPKDVKIKFTQAILAGGNVNLGNGDTQAGTTPTTLVANEGDVHTNLSLTIGPNGSINGDASASQSINNAITNNSNVTGTVTPNAPEKPIPKVDYQNPFPTTACVNTGTANNIIYNGDCTVTGDINLTGSKTLTITGKVYVQGSYSEAGNAQVIGEVVSGKIPMLIARYDLSTAGNGSTTSTNNKMLFVSVEGDMSVVGNGTVRGLFINDNPNGSVHVTGNADIFGGIIARGSVDFSGNQASVTRNIDFENFPQKISPDDYNMRLMSWKEIN